jgi:hypothetical protein
MRITMFIIIYLQFANKLSTAKKKDDPPEGEPPNSERVKSPLFYNS